MASAAESLPEKFTLEALEEAASGCRGCPLCKKPLESPLALVPAVTIHPSALLRLRDHDEREAESAAFVDDLEGVAASLKEAA